MSSDPLPPVAPRRSFLASLLLAAVVFTGGAVVGGGVTLVVVGKRIQEASQRPELMPERMADRLSRKLDLDPSQRARVKRVFEQHNEEFMGLRRDHVRRIRSPLQRVASEVEQELTPEQAVRFRAHLTELVDRFAPGGLSSVAPGHGVRFDHDKRDHDKRRGPPRMRDRLGERMEERLEERRGLRDDGDDGDL